MSQSEESRPQILLVDDEPLVLSSYGRVLRRLNMDIIMAEGPQEGLRVLEQQPIDVVVADYRMPGMNGDEFLEAVRNRWPDVIRMLNTAYADVQMVENVIRRGEIFRFLTKPCDPNKLKAAIQDAMAHRRQLRETVSQSRKLELDLHSFRKIFESALDPMMVAEINGRLVEVNEAFVQSTAISREEALKKRPYLLSTWIQEANWPQILDLLLKNGHWSDEVHHIKDDRHAIMSISVIKDQEEKPYALAAIEKDVTMRHQLERESWAAQYEVILALAKLAEYRDPETGAHLERMRLYSKAVTLQLAKLPKYAGIIENSYAEAIYASSPLHDIGKVGIPDSVLLKPGKLTAEEWRVMQLHTIIGAEVLSAAGKSLSQKNWLTMARTIASEHHEKWDGSGYPKGIKGDAIDLSARVVALADAYDAITSKRVYKDAMSHDEARSRILESSGSHFDPTVVQAFLDAEQEILRIKRHFSETDLPQDGDLVQVSNQTGTWRRIEELVDSSAGRKS
jgi:PAS domain S-box-containing protein